jgi:hypothetical protein
LSYLGGGGSAPEGYIEVGGVLASFGGIVIEVGWYVAVSYSLVQIPNYIAFGIFQFVVLGLVVFGDVLGC